MFFITTTWSMVSSWMYRRVRAKVKVRVSCELTRIELAHNIVRLL